MKKVQSKILLVILVALALFCFFILDLSQFASLVYIKERQAQFFDFYIQNQFISYGIFLLTYSLTTALAIPVGPILTLVAAVTFGFFPALILCSFSTSIGAALAFLSSRFLFYDWVQKKYVHRLEIVNRGVKAEGGLYLFFLKLNPIFPFFLVNTLSGLTPIPLWKFYWISQISMLPVTAIFVFAGTELSKISNISEILSLKLGLALGGVGLLPLLVKKTYRKARSRAVST
ncbi:MAG: VTT domain-containing protein [SAR324 cluster bacterium]|nr:VTT domain-containing protein [SAR324 cluster bacterium]